MSDADPTTVNHVRRGRQPKALCGHTVTIDKPTKDSTCNACVALLIGTANEPTWTRYGTSTKEQQS